MVAYRVPMPIKQLKITFLADAVLMTQNVRYLVRDIGGAAAPVQYSTTWAERGGTYIF